MSIKGIKKSVKKIEGNKKMKSEMKLHPVDTKLVQGYSPIYLINEKNSGFLEYHIDVELKRLTSTEDLEKAATTEDQKFLLSMILSLPEVMTLRVGQNIDGQRIYDQLFFFSYDILEIIEAHADEKDRIRVVRALVDVGFGSTHEMIFRIQYLGDYTDETLFI